MIAVLLPWLLQLISERMILLLIKWSWEYTKNSLCRRLYKKHLLHSRGPISKLLGVATTTPLSRPRIQWPHFATLSMRGTASNHTIYRRSNFCKDHRDKAEVPDPLVLEDLISFKFNSRRKLARLIISLYCVISLANFRLSKVQGAEYYRLAP